VCVCVCVVCVSIDTVRTEWAPGSVRDIAQRNKVESVINLCPPQTNTQACACAHIYMRVHTHTHDHTAFRWGYEANQTLLHWSRKREIIKILYKRFWQFSKKVKHTPTVWPSHSDFCVFTQEKWSLCLRRNLYTNVPRSLICDSHKLETTRMSINGQTDESPYISTVENHSTVEAGSINSR